MPRMADVGIPWANVWICSVPGSQDPGTEIMVDIEETMEPEDPAIMAEEPAITQINLREEVTIRAGSSRTQRKSPKVDDYCRTSIRKGKSVRCKEEE